MKLLQSALCELIFSIYRFTLCYFFKEYINFDENKLVVRVNNPNKLQAFRDLGIRAMSPTLSTI